MDEGPSDGLLNLLFSPRRMLLTDERLTETSRRPVEPVSRLPALSGRHLPKARSLDLQRLVDVAHAR